MADITANHFLLPSVSNTITVHHGNTWCPFLCPAMLFPLPLCVWPFFALHLVDFYFKIFLRSLLQLLTLLDALLSMPATAVLLAVASQLIVVLYFSKK